MAALMLKTSPLKFPPPAIHISSDLTFKQRCSKAHWLVRLSQKPIPVSSRCSCQCPFRTRFCFTNKYLRGLRQLNMILFYSSQVPEKPSVHLLFVIHYHVNLKSESQKNNEEQNLPTFCITSFSEIQAGPHLGR